MMISIRNTHLLIPITKLHRNAIMMFQTYKNMKMGTLGDQLLSLDHKHKEIKNLV